jgi:hypothetical protein
MNKEELDGIILILSCQKHLNTRLKEFKLSYEYYNNYKVIYVIGDLFLEKDYELKDKQFLWIKTEDSYLHLLKKLSLAIKYVYEIYDIKEGILRCGDDLLFNEDRLINFINNKKYDFYGQAYCGEDYYNENIEVLKKLRTDYFMYEYYRTHPEDILNPNHNLKNTKIEDYLVRPDIWGPAGVIYYLSNKSCNILIKHMENINYNILHFDLFTNNKDFYDTENSICMHTNRYK